MFLGFTNHNNKFVDQHDILLSGSREMVTIGCSDDVNPVKRKTPELHWVI